MIHRASALLLCAALAAQSKTVPAYLETVEGNSTNTYPLGRATAGLQWLIDAPLLTTGSGLITALNMRPNGALTTSSTGYTKGYKITLWTTTVIAAAMTTNAATNAGAATPTVAFNASLSIPNAPALAVVPSPYTVRFAFGTPYPFNGAAGNLLMQIETTDTSAPPTTWPVDAFTTDKALATGYAAQVGSVCSAGTVKLALAPGGSTTRPPLAIVGGSIVGKHTITMPGALPLAVAILGATNAAAGYPINLGLVGMPGCTLNVEPAATQTLSETGGLMPDAIWPIPPIATLAGGAVYIQSFGSASLVTLTGSVTSESWVIVIGSGSVPGVRSQSIFSTNLTTWSISGVGEFHPVIKLEGVFP